MTKEINKIIVFIAIYLFVVTLYILGMLFLLVATIVQFKITLLLIGNIVVILTYIYGMIKVLSLVLPK